MNMKSRAIEVFCIMLLYFFTSSFSFADASVNLLFHMGAGINGKFYVGGTLENRGSEKVYNSYVVITPLTKDCYPGAPHVSQLGGIEAGRKIEFKIPIDGPLYGYKLDVVHASDSYGNPVNVIDETESAISEKKSKYVEACNEKRGIK